MYVVVGNWVVSVVYCSRFSTTTYSVLGTSVIAPVPNPVDPTLPVSTTPVPPVTSVLTDSLCCSLVLALSKLVASYPTPTPTTPLLCTSGWFYIFKFIMFWLLEFSFILERLFHPVLLLKIEISIVTGPECIEYFLIYLIWI